MDEPYYPVRLSQKRFIPQITAQEAEILRSWVPDHFQFGTWEYCTYCGALPVSRDHVIPYSMLFPGETRGEHRGIKTPACTSCNCILSSLYFSTFQARVYYVVMQLKARNKRLLRLPDWSSKELDEISPEMRGFIFRKRRLRQNVIERLEWHQGVKFLKIMQEATQEAKAIYPNNVHLHNFLTLEL
jgi:hypothetical protein